MNIKIKGKNYEVSTNLGTAYDIEHKFNKNVKDIIASIDDYDMDMLMQILYVGFKRKNPDIKEEEFKELVLSDDNITYLGFIKEITIFCRLCMSFNKSEVEVRKQIEGYYEEKLAELESSDEIPVFVKKAETPKN